MIKIKLLFQVAAEQMKPRAEVSLEFLPSEDLSSRAGCLTAPYFELEQTIARSVIALDKEKIVLVLRVDVRDSPAVSDDLDRLRQVSQRNGWGRSRTLPRCGEYRQQEEKRKTERDRVWFEAIARFFTRKSPFQERGNYLQAPLPASILLGKLVSARLLSLFWQLVC